MSDFSTVECYEEHNSRSYNFAAEGSSISVQLRFAWSNRYTLALDLLSPRTWPYSPFQGMVVKTVGITGAPGDSYDQDGQALAYTEGLASVTYTMPDFDEPDEPNDDLRISEILEPVTEFTTMDYKRFRWGAKNGDPLLEAEAPGRLVRSHKLVRTIYGLASVPSSVLDLQGACNDTQYTSSILGLVYPEETLLFGSLSLSRSINVLSGASAFTGNTQMIFKKGGWNKYWRGKTQDYEEIFDVESAAVHKNYPPEDFSDWLF